MSKVLLAIMFAIGVSGVTYAAADDTRQIKMKDGSSLVVFKDGKMAMRDSKGQSMTMKDGTAMETADGKHLMMRGNEVWRRTSAEDLFKPQ